MGPTSPVQTQVASTAQSQISLPKTLLLTFVGGVFSYVATRPLASLRNRIVITMAGAATGGSIPIAYEILANDGQQVANRPEVVLRPDIHQPARLVESPNANEVTSTPPIEEVEDNSEQALTAYAQPVFPEHQAAPIHSDKRFQFSQHVTDEDNNPVHISSSDFYVPIALSPTEDVQLPEELETVMAPLHDQRHYFLPSTLFSEEVCASGLCRFRCDDHLIELQFGPLDADAEPARRSGRRLLSEWIRTAKQKTKEEDTVPYLFLHDLPEGARILHNRLLREPKKLQISRDGTIHRFDRVPVAEVPEPIGRRVQEAACRLYCPSESAQPVTLVITLPAFENFDHIQLHIDGSWLYIYADKRRLKRTLSQPMPLRSPGSHATLPQTYDYLTNCIRLPGNVDLSRATCRLLHGQLTLTIPRQQGQSDTSTS